MNCDRQLMTDPCIAALRRLIANPAARTGWRERLREYVASPGASTPIAGYSGLTFRISTQQASPSAICRRRLFPIVLILAPPR